MLTFAISLQALPPIFDKITQEIPFTNSQAGMLMGAYAIPGIFLPFLVAFLASRYNKKNLILISLLMVIAGLAAFSQARSFATLLIYRLLAGIGATALVVLAPLLVTIFFDESNMGIAMGIFNTGVPCGTVIAANLFGAMGEAVKWRSIILGLVAFTGMVFVVTIFMLSIPIEKETQGADKEKDADGSSPWSNSSFWLLGLIWAFTNAMLLSYVTFGPQYFQKFGLSVQRSGLLTSLIMMIPIFISPIIGIILDKTGWKKQLLFVESIISAVSFILLGRATSILSLWAIGLGLGFAPMPVIVFSLLPDIVEPRWVGMGLGMLTCASNLGIAIGPWGFGLILDYTQSNFSLGFIILALVALANIISSLKIGDYLGEK